MTGRVELGEAFVVLVVSWVLAIVVLWLLHSVSAVETDQLTRLPNLAGLEDLLGVKGGMQRRVFTPGAMAARRELEAEGRVDDQQLTIN